MSIHGTPKTSLQLAIERAKDKEDVVLARRGRPPLRKKKKPLSPEAQASVDAFNKEHGIVYRESVLPTTISNLRTRAKITLPKLNLPEVGDD